MHIKKIIIALFLILFVNHLFAEGFSIIESTPGTKYSFEIKKGFLVKEGTISIKDRKIHTVFVLDTGACSSSYDSYVNPEFSKIIGKLTLLELHKKIEPLLSNTRDNSLYLKTMGAIFSNTEILHYNSIEANDFVYFFEEDPSDSYANLYKILNHYDKYIDLLPSDTVVFSEPKYDSSEKIFVKLENELAKYGCNVIDIPKQYLILQHASREDLMLMIKLLNPKYYIPVKGDYRYMVGNANLASSKFLGVTSIDITF